MLNSLHGGYIFMSFCRLIFFFSKSSFSKNSFQNTIRVSNSLDADQARHVRPELDPNCLQNFQHRALVGRVKNWVDSLMVPFQSCSKT